MDIFSANEREYNLCEQTVLRVVNEVRPKLAQTSRSDVRWRVWSEMTYIVINAPPLFGRKRRKFLA